MSNTFQQQNYPLGIQCGRQFWAQADLNSNFRQPIRPARTYLLHLVADRLRKIGDSSLSPAELELWATLNQVLRMIGSFHLSSRNCRVQRHRLELDDSGTDLPELDSLWQNFLELFPTVSISLAEQSIAQLLTTLDSAGGCRPTVP